MCDVRLQSRAEYMLAIILSATEDSPVFIDTDRDRKLFYKIAKKNGFVAKVRKAVKGGWWACVFKKSLLARKQNEEQTRNRSML